MPHPPPAGPATAPGNDMPKSPDRFEGWDSDDGDDIPPWLMPDPDLPESEQWDQWNELDDDLLDLFVPDEEDEEDDQR
jgi:hypothetical protein